MSHNAICATLIGVEERFFPACYWGMLPGRSVSMPAGIGPLELGLILLIVIVIFGAGKLPELGGALGRGIKEFRGAVRDTEPGDENPKQR